MRFPRTLTITVLCGTIIFFLLFLWLGWAKYLSLRIRVALAEEQIRYFQEALDAASKQGSVDEIEGYIEAINNYYPSGTKQVPGSQLDLMVEHARSNAVQTLEQRRRGPITPTE